MNDRSLVVNPGDHAEEVGHERGDVALEEDVVAPYDVGLVHVCLVVLGHHCDEREVIPVW